MRDDANDRPVVLVTGGARRIGAAIVQRRGAPRTLTTRPG